MATMAWGKRMPRSSVNLARGRILPAPHAGQVRHQTFHFGHMALVEPLLQIVAVHGLVFFTHKALLTARTVLSALLNAPMVSLIPAISRLETPMARRRGFWPLGLWAAEIDGGQERRGPGKRQHG